MSLYVQRDRKMRALITAGLEESFVPVISVVTLAEQRRNRNSAAYRYAVSQATVVDATRPIAERAAELLEAAELDGHECLIDAFVVSTASFATGGARVASSDGSHIPPLCKAATALTGRPIGVLAV
ncbi:hypothetical protein ACFQ07_00565 [Actinomadura adrarensis]|uniref:Uncharacterized protein n=1 Tax=Actinomadura adrarensis TaxID=1819600 RepID=A0ABW3C9Z8_9ACTN